MKRLARATVLIGALACSYLPITPLEGQEPTFENGRYVYLVEYRIPDSGALEGLPRIELADWEGDMETMVVFGEPIRHLSLGPVRDSVFVAQWLSRLGYRVERLRDGGLRR